MLCLNFDATSKKNIESYSIRIDLLQPFIKSLDSDKRNKTNDTTFESGKSD